MCGPKNSAFGGTGSVVPSPNITPSFIEVAGGFEDAAPIFSQPFNSFSASPPPLKRPDSGGLRFPQNTESKDTPSFPNPKSELVRPATDDLGKTYNFGENPPHSKFNQKIKTDIAKNLRTMTDANNRSRPSLEETYLDETTGKVDLKKWTENLRKKYAGPNPKDPLATRLSQEQIRAQNEKGSRFTRNAREKYNVDIGETNIDAQRQFVKRSINTTDAEKGKNTKSYLLDEVGLPNIRPTTAKEALRALDSAIRNAAGDPDSYGIPKTIVRAGIRLTEGLLNGVVSLTELPARYLSGYEGLSPKHIALDKPSQSTNNVDKFVEESITLGAGFKGADKVLSTNRSFRQLKRNKPKLATLVTGYVSALAFEENREPFIENILKTSSHLRPTVELFQNKKINFLNFEKRVINSFENGSVPIQIHLLLHLFRLTSNVPELELK